MRIAKIAALAVASCLLGIGGTLLVSHPAPHVTDRQIVVAYNDGWVGAKQDDADQGCRVTVPRP